MHELKIEPLTRAAFSAFGDVIEASDSVNHYAINKGNTERYHDLADVQVGEDGKAILSIFRGQARQLPFVVSMMERHPKASQAFVPMSGRPYLVVVADRASEPHARDLRLFLARADQGVNYAPGVWHHPLLALHAASDFLVVDRSGPGHNCDEVMLAEPAVIQHLV